MRLNQQRAGHRHNGDLQTQLKLAGSKSALELLTGSSVCMTKLIIHCLLGLFYVAVQCQVRLDRWVTVAGAAHVANLCYLQALFTEQLLLQPLPDGHVQVSAA